MSQELVPRAASAVRSVATETWGVLFLFSSGPRVFYVKKKRSGKAKWEDAIRLFLCRAHTVPLQRLPIFLRNLWSSRSAVWKAVCKSRCRGAVKTPSFDRMHKELITKRLQWSMKIGHQKLPQANRVKNIQDIKVFFSILTSCVVLLWSWN